MLTSLPLIELAELGQKKKKTKEVLLSLLLYMVLENVLFFFFFRECSFILLHVTVQLFYSLTCKL